MKPTQTISDFGVILLFVIGALVIICGAFFANKLLRTQKPNEVKISSYESGEEATGIAWGHFNIRFYSIALFFLLFEVELLILFPYSIILGNNDYQQLTHGLWGWFILGEIFIFVALLAIGLLYVWKKGFLTWEMPKINNKDIDSVVPKNLYEALNEKYKSK
jgi:NADH-quinone oxidoreductase subunit A